MIRKTQLALEIFLEDSYQPFQMYNQKLLMDNESQPTLNWQFLQKFQDLIPRSAPLCAKQLMVLSTFTAHFLATQEVLNTLPL